MASQTLTLVIASQLQGAGFTEAAEQMRKLQAELDGTSKKTDAWGEILSKVKGLLVVGTITAFFKTAVDEAIKAEQSQLRLKTSVESTGMSWDKTSSQINNFTTSLSKLSRFAKGELDDALNILIQRTNSVKVAQANLATVMGISVATGQDVASVADQIGRAANGSERDLKQLAKTFGVTGSNAKDANYVLNLLSQRFGDLATTEKTTASEFAKLKNTFSDFAQEVGEDIAPAVVFLIEGIKRLFLAFKEIMGSGIAAYFGFIAGALTLNKDLMLASLRQLKDGVVGAWDALAGNDVADKVKTNGKKTTAAVGQMSEELKVIFKDLEAKRKQVLADASADEKQTILNRLAFDKAKIMERADFEILTTANKNKIIKAMEAEANAEILALAKGKADKIVAITGQIGEQAGIATAKMLTGQMDSWQDFTKAVIDLAVNAAIAMINVYTAEKVAEHLVAEDYYGAAKAAAVGAIEVGAVKAAGEVAKTFVGTSSNQHPISGGGSSTVGTSSAVAASAPSAQTVVNIHVHGDMTNDPAITDRLIARISSAVENRSVRLVASQVQ